MKPGARVLGRGKKLAVLGGQVVTAVCLEHECWAAEMKLAVLGGQVVVGGLFVAGTTHARLGAHTFFYRWYA